jgi:protein O-mannosyl-transferase
VLNVERNPAAERDKSGGGRAWSWAPFVVAMTAFAVHAHSIAFGFVDLDDRDFIVDDHAFLARPADLLRAFARPYMHVVAPAHPYHRPIVTASFVLDAQWSGTRPFGYHLTNVVLHSIASVLCLGLIRRLGFAPVLTILAALLFAVHPALGSAVAWIPGRNESLLAVSVLGAWIAFASHVERPSWRAMTTHVALFALALFTKETAVMLPLVCAVHAAWLGAARPFRAASFRSVIVFTPGWAACFALRFAAQRLAIDGGPVTAAEIAGQLRPLPSGLAELAFPFSPSLIGVASDSTVAGGLLAAVLAAVFVVAVRGIRPGTVFFGAVVFVLWSLPPLVTRGTLVLGSRLYLPAVGVVIAAAELMRALKLEARVLGAFGAAAIAILAVIAAGYEATFRNPRSFAQAAVEAAPRSPVAHFCMGAVDQRAGDYDRALAEYARAIDLGSTYVVHNNVAVIEMARGRWADAERELDTELAVDPGYAVAYRNLAIVLRHEGRTDDAIDAEARAQRLAGESEPGRTRSTR